MGDITKTHRCFQAAVRLIDIDYCAFSKEVTFSLR